MSIPSLTELILLKALWRKQPLSAREIHLHAVMDLLADPPLFQHALEREAGAPLASPITPPRARSAPAPEPASASASTPGHAWLVGAGRAWLVLYLLGLSHALYRWWRGVRMLDALARCGDQLVELAGHAGFVGQTKPKLPAVIEIDAPISPMLHGVFRTLLTRDAFLSELARSSL